MSNIDKAYDLAKQRYAELGVDTEVALKKLATIAISIHCWQGDDVSGFEDPDGDLTGGIAVSGNYPGKARTPGQLRDDFEKAVSLIPGQHRFSLHASYAETGGAKVERDQLEPSHFQSWMDWARDQNLKLDFNPTYFSHAKSDDGFTLAHSNKAIRQFWIDHGIRCRQIGAAMGEAQGAPCITNFWIPDGYKDTPVDRRGPRERLVASLDEIFSTSIDPALNRDAVECKLFGIGSESYVVGSHEFYLGYAARNQKLLCVGAGHFHPTDVISDKISSVLQWVEELLLHVSRGVRWDSDHVVTMTDELHAIAQEIVRGNYLDRVNVGLDFFDASINRIAAWVIGTRATLKALLMALLDPIDLMRDYESNGDFTARLVLLEEMKDFPAGAVWDYYCQSQDVPVGSAWLEDVRRYEAAILKQR